MNWADLIRDMNRLWALVSTVLKVLVP